MASETPKVTPDKPESALLTDELRPAGVHQRVRRNPLEILANKPNSMRAAINAKCYDCIGPDPGWKWAVGNCESTDCPLHRFRPYQKKVGQPPEGVYRLDE